VPGLWLRGNWQRGYRFVIPGGTTQTIRASYLFRRMTPMATLRIQLGPPSEDGGGTSVPAPFYDTTLVVGARNPAATDPRLDFDHLATAHLELFAWRGSLAAQRLQALAASREAALSQVADLLAVAPPAQIRLVFYPDSASKTSQTGHIGAGFASGTTIVEIFNDSVQLDPFHEITHIVSYARGSPPALLDEGFAVYVSERLGADALKYLGAPGRTVAATVCAQRQAGALFPLPRLFRFTDIGSDSTRPDVSYPQAASVVAFLVERFGIERFRELYGRLESDTAVSIQRRNEAVLAELYGMDSAALDSVWIAWLNCP